MRLLGVDIGGTKIAAGVIESETGEVLASERIATNASEGGEAVLTRAVELAVRLAEREGPVSGVGIGAAGQIDPVAGVVVDATPLLPGWAGQRLSEAFTRALGVPAFADNDVNALAAGELRFGAGRGFSHLVFLALGTGVGGALVHDGKLVHGPLGQGTELGHLILYPDAPSVDFTTRGSLEQFCCGRALKSHFVENGGDPNLDGPEIAKLVVLATPAALSAARQVGEDLGLGLASLANVFGPEAFLIGGGLIDGLGEYLLEPARKVYASRVLRAMATIPILPAGLGRDAAIVGAACLAL
jgi:glucokinase